MCISIYQQGKDKERKSKNRDVDEDVDEEESTTSPLEVGHNMYILAYKLADHKKEIRDELEKKTNEDAIKTYADNTAQIEVEYVDY